MRPISQAEITYSAAEECWLVIHGYRGYPGHGTSWKDPSVGKIVLACPSLENLQMPLHSRIILRVAGLFTPRLNCHWHHSSVNKNIH